MRRATYVADRSSNPGGHIAHDGRGSAAARVRSPRRHHHARSTARFQRACRHAPDAGPRALTPTTLPLTRPLRAPAYPGRGASSLPRRGCGERVGARSMLRFASLLLLCFISIPLAAVGAAEPPPASQPAPVSADELERLVRTLQDESARAKLVEQLRALIAAQRGCGKRETRGGGRSSVNCLSKSTPSRGKSLPAPA